jgi:hypothetical protein
MALGKFLKNLLETPPAPAQTQTQTAVAEPPASAAPPPTPAMEAPAEPTFPYRATKSLLTPTEHAFYNVLKEIVPPNLVIFSKVRLPDLLWLPYNIANKRAHFNRISAKHVDFVLCDAETLTPRLIIELDDPSHDASDRTERDAFVNGALDAAGFSIMRVPVQKQYHRVNLAATLKSCLK